jgi:hypothetical protein
LAKANTAARMAGDIGRCHRAATLERLVLPPDIGTEGRRKIGGLILSEVGEAIRISSGGVPCAIDLEGRAGHSFQ